MENIELQKIWKHIDSEINQKSKEELNLLLTSKVRQTLNIFVITNIIAIPVSLGVLVWLITTSLNRLEDTIYLINNMLLGIIVLFSFFYGFWYWYKFKEIYINKPVAKWLEEKIHLLSNWLTGRYKNLEFYLFPLVFILVFLSIHIYFAELKFMEVFSSDKFIEEDIWGIIIFQPIILAIGFYYLIKIRKYYLKKLEFLKDLHRRLCSL